MGCPASDETACRRRSYGVGWRADIEEFYRRYEEASGLVVDPKRLLYFRVFNDFQVVVHMLATAWRVASLGKTDKDAAVAWISMIGNVATASLRSSLEEVL